MPGKESPDCRIQDWLQLEKRAMCVTARVGGRAVTKRHISEIDHERLTAEIANLAGLGNDELKARWKAAYGVPRQHKLDRMA